MKAKHFDKISKALADAKRMQILEDITKNPMQTCFSVCEKIDIGQPTVSHHIKILKEAGLINYKKQGQHHIFWANNKFMNSYVFELQSRLTGEPAKAV